MYVTIVFMLVFQLFVNLNINNVIGKIFAKKFVETTVTVEDLLPVSNMFYHFDLNDDGTITANDKEAWLAIFWSYAGLPEYNRYACMDMYISETSSEGAYFHTYTIGGYELIDIPMHKGVVEIPLDNLLSTDSGMRLDIGMAVGNTYRVDKIVINDNKKIVDGFTRRLNQTVFCVIYGIILALVIFLSRNISIKTDNIVINWIKNKMIANKENLFCISLTVGIIMILLAKNVPGAFYLLVLLFAAFVFGINVPKLVFFSKPLVQRIWAVGTIVISSGFVFATMLLKDNNTIVWFGREESEYITSAFLSALIYVIAISIVAFLEAYVDNKKGEKQRFVNFLPISIIYFAAEMIIFKMINYYNREMLINSARYSMKTGEIFLNIMLIYLIYLFLANLLGTHLSNLIVVLLATIPLIGNIIEIHFQNTMFDLGDISLVGEAIGIADAYISKSQIVMIIIALIVVTALCIIFRKKIIRYLKPSFCLGIIFLFPIMIIFTISFNKKNFKTEYMEYNSGTGLTNKAQATEYGLSVLYIGQIISNDGANETKRPKDYDEDYFKVIDDIEPIDSQIDSDVKPDVILIMAESLCDIRTKQSVVTFNIDPFENMRKYQLTNVISPCYGGRTVMAEYEALMGMSNYFIDGNTIAFTAYFNSGMDDVGGLVYDFNRNGYNTVAMHPNIPDYYNRDVVYDVMGFDEYISLAGFSYDESDMLKDDRLNDGKFIDNIIQKLESTDEPQFIFGVTFAGHSPYLSKYDDTVISAESDVVTGYDLVEVQNYAESVYELDLAFEDLYDYVMNRDKPTIVYMWGDHMPPLNMNRDYLSDLGYKYTVPLMGFSNFENISIEQELISPNQISTQIIKDSGIEHNKYFDYVYSLRNTYPVIQSEWLLDLDDATAEIYNSIQYDLLFGKRYLLK